LQECFGAGTAAVVSHVSDITWRDRKIELPPIDAEHRPVGTRLKSHINRLRMGLEHDEFHWLRSCAHSGVLELAGTQEVVA
jgi:branched-chain amino acid aminotransferase